MSAALAALTMGKGENSECIAEPGVRGDRGSTVKRFDFGGVVGPTGGVEVDTSDGAPVNLTVGSSVS